MAYESTLSILRYNGLALANYSTKTFEMCLTAVKQNARSVIDPLSMPPEKYEEICLEVVMTHGEILEYIPRKTDIVCYRAVRSNGLALKYVDKTCVTISQPFYNNLCVAAVRENERVICTH